MFTFVALGIVSSVLGKKFVWEKNIDDLFCVEWDIKTWLNFNVKVKACEVRHSSFRAHATITRTKRSIAGSIIALTSSGIGPNELLVHLSKQIWQRPSSLTSVATNRRHLVILSRLISLEIQKLAVFSFQSCHLQARASSLFYLARPIGSVLCRRKNVICIAADIETRSERGQLNKMKYTKCSPINCTTQTGSELTVIELGK